MESIHHFTSSLFEDKNVESLHNSYRSSQPFKYTVVDALFQSDLLTKVKDECINELSFAEKETDIYKVHQTGDLASLSFLEKDQINRLTNLLTLRNALYAKQFRAFIRNVTGCGPLSATKADMSVNSYKKGCHLLNHDDVIGTRRVSYILYMPLPESQAWQQEWGGALELYPTRIGSDGIPEPEPIPCKSIPPSWNQFIFFEVQPGKSFHSVEEVVVGGDGDERQRLSISGWFHAAQEGEEDYEPLVVPENKSSLEQLTSSKTVFDEYSEGDPITDSSEVLSKEHIEFLSQFLNPAYLKERTLNVLAEKFIEESSVELHSFLKEKIVDKLRVDLLDLDLKDGLSGTRQGKIPSHLSGIQETDWSLKGPPHKWRYCTLSPQPQSQQLSSQILGEIKSKLFPSPAFRAWLFAVSSYLPLGHAIEVRRFRPGLDYMLATSEEEEARLDVVLGLTPPPPIKRKKAKKLPNGKLGKRKEKEKEQQNGWEEGLWGGWECYMAPHEGEEDPAVYRSGSSKRKNDAAPNDQGKEKDVEMDNDDEDEDDAMEEDDESEDDESEDDESDEDDSALLTVQPGFNRLLMVLRDEKVMRFVKYVSSVAEGSRWDVNAEYKIGKIESDDES